MNNKKNTTPLWEKIIGALGLLLLCTGFIYLTWTKIIAEESPLRIEFNVQNITQTDEHFLVTVNVENTSLQSATALQVEGVLLQKGTPIEKVNMQIDYVPSNSNRNIGFIFKQDPRAGKLEFRALGYQEP